jgi:tRNA pseudouridine55 synthase
VTRGDVHGVVVVDKPSGMTSAAVVARVKRALGARRVGHTGTLDPMATGVLPLCLGDATRLADFLLAEDKAYDACLELGVETDTLDAEGAVTRRQPDAAAAVDEAALREAMARLVGESEQVPPMYSAIKHQGRRLHALARAGHTVERTPRRIRVDRFELVELSPPHARVLVHCSKGTYIRSLVADVGEALGCGATVTALRRVRAGAFHIEQAVSLDAIERGEAPPLISPADAVGHLEAVEVPPGRLGAVGNGLRLPWRALAGDAAAPDGLVRLLTADGALVAVACVEAGKVKYSRVFPHAAGKRDSGLTNAP